MSRHITLFALWLLPLWACAGNDANGPRYLVERGASANVLQVRLTMQGEPPFTLLPARQLPGSATPVSSALVCLADNQPIALNQPFSCKEVGWQVTLTLAPTQGADASAQQSLLFAPDQWLLTEWGNFVRQQGSHQGKVCQPDGSCQPLPDVNQPPLILPFGLQTVPVTKPDPRLVLSHDEIANQLDLPALQQQLNEIIDYLAFQLDVAPPTHPWQLVWLGRDVTTHSLGGAAGDQVFVANYPTMNGKPTPQAPLRLLRTSAYEAVHILNARSSTPQPTWVEESLAEYLAIKALRRFRLHQVSAINELAERGKQLPHNESGLYRAAREVMAGDRSYYPLFYVKGSAFWEALERELQHNDVTLARLLPQLGWLPDGRFDTASSELLAGTIGSDTWRRLSRRYLGEPQ
ncbi:hypothetical protein ONR73_18005 [Aeromonas veronii]|uniref:hypothetical protein n=1 Tax=Aeromonas veronii TaxID=654 RepID=UPI00222FB327|nr:hypothetical protein [Aeromonas veronii]UZE58750.1 hypothetical protein ONR73_18005 [Aeromonas veronii]